MAGITCLLIDDDVDDLEIFAIAVEQINRDIACVTAANGEDALMKLNTDHTLNPDFIFLDMNMPRMDGKQCLAAIKKIERFAKTPVIMYSTSAEPRDVEETQRLGASHFLMKPSNIVTLTNQLSMLLSSSKNNVA
jgi:CheY-like chemotaxis protein